MQPTHKSAFLLLHQKQWLRGCVYHQLSHHSLLRHLGATGQIEQKYSPYHGSPSSQSLNCNVQPPAVRRQLPSQVSISSFCSHGPRHRHADCYPSCQRPIRSELHSTSQIVHRGVSSSCSASSAFSALGGERSLRLVPVPQLCNRQVRYSSTEPTTVYESLLDSRPVHFAESVFQFAHSATGLPWWATIVGTTFALRLVLTLPLAIFSQNIRARVEGLQPEVIVLAKRAFVERFSARAKHEKWSEKRAQRAFVGLVRRYSKELYVRDNCHPAKGSILFLVQLPMWIFLSLSLRNMTGAFSERMFVDPASIVPELATGGTLWFTSLAAPDPTLILPVLVGVLNLANIEMHALHKGRVTRLQRYLNNTLRTVSVVMVPVAACVPSAMSLYWTVSALYGLGQNILLKAPSARRALGIRPSKADSDTPFRDMGEEFVERYIKRGGGKEQDDILEELEDGSESEQHAENSGKKSKSR